MSIGGSASPSQISRRPSARQTQKVFSLSLSLGTRTNTAHRRLITPRFLSFYSSVDSFVQTDNKCDDTIHGEDQRNHPHQRRKDHENVLAARYLLIFPMMSVSLRSPTLTFLLLCQPYYIIVLTQARVLPTAVGASLVSPPPKLSRLNEHRSISTFVCGCLSLVTVTRHVPST